MNIKKVLVGAAASAIMLGAMAVPAFATSSVLQNMITYYTANNGSNFMRSGTPFTTGVATQADNPNGSVTVNISNTSGYADSGFAVYDGKLSDLSSFVLNGSGDQYGLNLWFDTNNDGEYFSWNSSNTLTGLAGDVYGLGPGSLSGKLTVDGSSDFFMIPGGKSYTLSQLQSGADSADGISGNTHVAVWVGVSGTGPKSATIFGPLVTDKNQCKKGGWKTFILFGKPAFRNQGQCVRYVEQHKDGHDDNDKGGDHDNTSQED